jgi:hypothetical protein
MTTSSKFREISVIRGVFQFWRKYAEMFYDNMKKGSIFHRREM